MSKVEEFIKKHSHIIENPTSVWISSCNARKAVEIAREEMIEKIKRLLKEKYLIKSAEPLRWVSLEKVFYDLKQAMKDET